MNPGADAGSCPGVAIGCKPMEKTQDRSLPELGRMALLKIKQITGWRGKDIALCQLAEKLSIIPLRGLREPVFVVGCSRSGTTVFYDFFVRHHAVAGWAWAEALQVWDPGYAKHAYEHHRSGDHARSPDEVTEADKRRIEAAFRWAQLLQAKPRFANKNTHNTVRMRYIRRMFPDARLIYVERDGRAVANSIINAIRQVPSRAEVPMGRFTKPPEWRSLLSDDLVEQSANQWLHVVNAAGNEMAQLPPGAVHRLRYEDLCDDPRGVMAAAWQYAGLEIDEKALATIPEKLQNRNSKWQTDRTPGEIKTMHRILAPKLVEMGYETGEQW